MADKKYTPIEAAVAVLNKAKEMYKGSTLAKAEGWKSKTYPHTGDPLESTAAGDAVKRMGSYKKTGDSVGHQIASEGAKTYHQDKLQGIKAAPKPNLGKSEEMPMKGHIKLAKFVGRMESKRGMAKTETGHEKGVATKMNPNSKEGMSTAGANVRLGDESAAKKEAVGRMTDAEQIKPKLP